MLYLLLPTEFTTPTRPTILPTGRLSSPDDATTAPTESLVESWLSRVGSERHRHGGLLLVATSDPGLA